MHVLYFLSKHRREGAIDTVYVEKGICLSLACSSIYMKMPTIPVKRPKSGTASTDINSLLSNIKAVA